MSGASRTRPCCSRRSWRSSGGGAGRAKKSETRAQKKRSRPRTKKPYMLPDRSRERLVPGQTANAVRTREVSGRILYRHILTRRVLTRRVLTRRVLTRRVLQFGSKEDMPYNRLQGMSVSPPRQEKHRERSQSCINASQGTMDFAAELQHPPTCSRTEAQWHSAPPAAWRAILPLHHAAGRDSRNALRGRKLVATSLIQPYFAPSRGGRDT